MFCCLRHLWHHLHYLQFQQELAAKDAELELERKQHTMTLHHFVAMGVLYKQVHCASYRIAYTMYVSIVYYMLLGSTAHYCYCCCWCSCFGIVYSIEYCASLYIKCYTVLGWQQTHTLLLLPCGRWLSCCVFCNLLLLHTFIYLLHCAIGWDRPGTWEHPTVTVQRAGAYHSLFNNL